ncbi:hypothetical protein Sgleb_47140 [Streptomyces glebosus]|uniref:Uncharacterized protein n=1 Tax=Streptomyces glebosus TaxID=249580 RepID=A0A640SZ07_9ACTN|nr:hypothetical protein Sgleb_47140 [Streptomyces glebosus]GHG75629.1 hypothetical protein GCM10010513_50240 [Streptomyces glebosus]
MSRRALPGWCRILGGLCGAHERKPQKVLWCLQRGELWAESPVWAVAPYARTPVRTDRCRRGRMPARRLPRSAPGLHPGASRNSAPYYAQSWPWRVAMAASVDSAV